MPNYKIEFLHEAWRDIDKISDFHLKMVGSASAQKIIGKILDTIDKLGDFPYMGAQYTDPELAKKEYRKILCGDYVCIYKVTQDIVYIYRIVNGKTNYPHLLK